MNGWADWLEQRSITELRALEQMLPGLIRAGQMLEAQGRAAVFAVEVCDDAVVASITVLPGEGG
jgi:hypothetical protein